MSSRTNSVQLARFLNGQGASNSVVLSGDLVGVFIQHTTAAEIKLQASLDNTVWWDVVSITGTLGAPIASASDRKFLTLSKALPLSGTTVRLISTVAVGSQVDCWISVAND
jgi:hypothetical protein